MEFFTYDIYYYIDDTMQKNSCTNLSLDKYIKFIQENGGIIYSIQLRKTKDFKDNVLMILNYQEHKKSTNNYTHIWKRRNNYE